MKMSARSEIEKARCPECGKEFRLKRLSIEKERLILTEDSDIYGFLAQACSICERSDEIQLMCYRSASELIPFLRVLADMANFSAVKTLVIARDADDNPDAAAQSIMSALQRMENADLPVPKKPFCFTANDNIRVAFVLFPGPDKNGKYQVGSIEDLCLALVSNDPLLRECVDPFIECAKVNQDNGETLTHPSKSRFQAYLAGKHHHAGLKVALAARCKLWDWNDYRISPFKELIEQM